MQKAVSALGPAPLREEALVHWIHPLFSRVLHRAGDEIYLANHSLGRPLDQTARDVQEALQCWYENMDDAWEDWLTEREAFRGRIARLINAARHDCIVPKSSAGQGLRAVLNCYDKKIGVVTTRDEFDSIDLILKIYAQRGRIDLSFVAPDEHGEYSAIKLLDAVGPSTALVVVSMVFFTTGQLLTDLQDLVAGAQAKGANVLVDLYHAAGIVPTDIQALGADFAIGGCYKYLRGGPGAGWLYVHPRHLNASLATLDTGWFAQPEPFKFERPATPKLAPGGNAFLESTPAILPLYQARAGLELTLTLGVTRLRDYSLAQQRQLEESLAAAGFPVLGAPERRGGFLAIAYDRRADVAAELGRRGIKADARDGLLRLCPDILNTEQEVKAAVARLAEVVRTA